MKILGIDTTTKFLCLGIYDNTNPVSNIIYGNRCSEISNGAKIYEYNLEVERRLSSLLTVTIKRVLDVLDWRINDINYFACGLGPGSFTGMRTGLSTIKGLSWATSKPVIGISTLDILARGAQNSDAFIVPIIDAKRNLIYCAVYKNKNKHLQRIKSYMLLNKEELIRVVKPNSIILGDAINLCKEKLLRDIKGVTILDKEYWYPKGRHIISLALERINNKKFDNPFNIKPIYLYPKECQIRAKK